MKRDYMHPRTKALILEKYNYTCCNCGVGGNFSSLEIDHVIPVSQGGTNNEDNLQVLCYKCNLDKRWNKMNPEFALEELSRYRNLKPKEKLELIKQKISEYKELSWEEFKIIFTQDPVFRFFRLDLKDVRGYFFEGKEDKDGKFDENKYKLQRDLIIKGVYEDFITSHRKLSVWLETKNIPLERTAIGAVLAGLAKIEENTENAY